MALIIQSSRPVFDTTQIEKGYLLYAKHRSWPEGHGGIVTGVNEDRLVVQYHPGIGNVTNHFFIPAQEVSDGEWEIRWSKDLTEVESNTASSNVVDLDGEVDDEL